MATHTESGLATREIRNAGAARPAFTVLELLVVTGVIAILIAILLPAVQSSREQARRVQCTNNLMQIGTALASYASCHSVLPPGVVNDKGPVSNVPVGYHFGWAVQILPFLGQPAMFREFDFSRSVYAPSNDTARGHRIGSYYCPSSPLYGSMSYSGCHHDVEAPIDADNHGAFYLNSRTRYGDITDGPAFTIFVGEYRATPGPGWAVGTSATLRNAGTPINGEDPIDPLQLSNPTASYNQSIDPSTWNQLIIDGKVPAARIGGFRSYHPGGANFLFGDGSVRFLSERIHPHIYRSLAHRADGNLISADEF